MQLGVRPELAPLTFAVVTNSQAPGARRRPRRSVGWFAGARALLHLWRRHLYERAELAKLSAHDRHDAGLSDAEAWVETRKWFWQE